MAAVDYAGLRSKTLLDGQDSEVTVNTRALIDKVLARYSSEHTTLRELIQNASDAGANTVVVKFETEPSPTVPVPHGPEKSQLLRHIIRNHTLKRLTVSNNGQPFTTADWNRLKSIADGNPDETKIGAFGVGFYSVFADCDEPFVVSGDKTMAFYWKGNTLSTKIATVPPEAASANTTFLLDYRQADPTSPSYNPAKLPNLPALSQFLANSLTFVGLQCIELHVDEFKVASFCKKASPPLGIRVPSGLKADTEGGMMRVTAITRHHAEIDAEWSNVLATAQDPVKRAAEVVQTEIKNAGTALKSFFSKFSTQTPSGHSKGHKIAAPVQAKPTGSDEDISGESKGIIHLQFCTVEVETRVTRTFSAEIERATKKPPPRTTRIALLTSPYHDSKALSSSSKTSGSTAYLASRIFRDVLPRDNGRVFIGFSTAQTTPFLAHVSAPSLIPTVERENVDMNARYISTWNIELLRVAGLACRISYSLDMDDIRHRVGKESISEIIPHATYVCKQFTPQTTHPSTALGERMVEAFFNCSKERSIAVLSSTGVKPSQSVRMPAETLSFLRDVPMVPQELATQAVAFFVSLHDHGFISELTMTDIQNGLDARALNEEELIEFLKWCGAKVESSELDSASVRKLFAVTVANIGVTAEGSSGKILALGAIDSYVNASRINPALPVPQETIPFSFSKAVPTKQLMMFGWAELTMFRWLQFLTTPPHLQELTTSEDCALQVLSCPSKVWDHLDATSRTKIADLLSTHLIMPTKMGMRRPSDSYFPSVKLFEDLPTVKHFQGSKEKFLTALGVRKTVDLATVFSRMKDQNSGQQSEASSLRHGDLIRYFASVIDSIPKTDLDHLCQTPFLPGQGVNDKGHLYKAQDLYAPNGAIVSLGLTQVKLPFEFKPNSKEADFLFRLGLNRFPDTPTIVNILDRAGQADDLRLWKLAIDYFLQNYSANNYASGAKYFMATSQKILPTEQAPFPSLVAPLSCFANEKAASLGFSILRDDLRPHADKFGVKQDPDISACVRRMLDRPPQSTVDAEQQFSYLAARSIELAQNQALIQRLSSSKIVPIFRKYYLEPHSNGFEDRSRQQKGKFDYRISRYDPPNTVFVGMDKDYAGIIDYVQFSPEATAFLLKVGAKHEPSSSDLASLLCQNPSQFLNTIGQERYLDLLRKLSDHAEALWKNNVLVKRMSTSRILLGYRDIKEDRKKSSPADDDGLDDLADMSVQREWSLNRPNDVVIIDDVQMMNSFQEYIIAAPQEEHLEEFYAKLGTRKITELVKEEMRIGALLRDQEPAQRLRKEIVQRAQIFLHEHERDASKKSIKHDANWLDTHLSVKRVSDITVTRTLAERGASAREIRTASISKSLHSGHVLNVTARFDNFEVARELIQLLIRRSRRNDIIALERILTEPLQRLQAKGINVERILRRKEHQARIAKQREETEREQVREQEVRDEKKAISANPPSKELSHNPSTPEKSHNMPGAFGTPEKNTDLTDDRPDVGGIGNWAKKFFKNNTTNGTDTGRTGTDGPQINRDIQVTKSNIADAINRCGPSNQNNINTPHHRDPTELDKGGYCSGEQWENLHKSFTVSHAGRKVDIFYGQHQTETAAEVVPVLGDFLQLIFALTGIFGVNPAAVSIFLDDKSNTVAFNLNGSIFFNLSWFRATDSFNTVEGKIRACDSWFLTYCHELAHNLVKDHNARHNWYTQQIAIEYSPKYRNILNRILGDMGIAG